MFREAARGTAALEAIPAAKESASGCQPPRVDRDTGTRPWVGLTACMYELNLDNFAALAAFRTENGFGAVGPFSNRPAD